MSYLAAGAAAMGVAGSVMGMSSRLSAIDSRATALDADAAGLKTEADVIQQSTDLRERQYALKASRVRSRGVAQAAASGVRLGVGTPLILELENIRQQAIGQFDIQRTGKLAIASRLLASAYKTAEARFTRSQRFGTILQGSMQAGSILASWGASGSWKGEGFGAAKDPVPDSSPFYSEGE